MKIVKKIQLKIAIFTAMKYRCILHGNVCVMKRGAKKQLISLWLTGIVIFKRHFQRNETINQFEGGGG